MYEFITSQDEREAEIFRNTSERDVRTYSYLFRDNSLELPEIEIKIQSIWLIDFQILEPCLSKRTSLKKKRSFERIILIPLNLQMMTKLGNNMIFLKLIF